MIIPIRCMTCNKVLASKYQIYLELVKDYDKNNHEKYITSDMAIKGKTPQEKAFELLGLNRYCCRRHLLGHVDIIPKLTK